MRRFFCFRQLVAVLACLLGVIGTLQIASARPIDPQRAFAGYIGAFEPGRFVGQVAALTGPAGNPTGMTLMLGTDTIDIRFGQRYTPRPISAEAEVEGLAVRDYASLDAQRVRGMWVAQRVEFDVQPFGRLRSVIGTVMAISPNGKRLRLRLADTGAPRWLTTVAQTRYAIDGRPTDGAVTFGRNQTVQALVLKEDFGWIATDVNLKLAVLGVHNGGQLQ